MCNSLGTFFPPQKTDKYVEIKLPLRSMCFSAPRQRGALQELCALSLSISPAVLSRAHHLQPRLHTVCSSMTAPVPAISYLHPAVNGQLPLLALCDLSAALDPVHGPHQPGMLSSPGLQDPTPFRPPTCFSAHSFAVSSAQGLRVWPHRLCTAQFQGDSAHGNVDDPPLPSPSCPNTGDLRFSFSDLSSSLPTLTPRVASCNLIPTLRTPKHVSSSLGLAPDIFLPTWMLSRNPMFHISKTKFLIFISRAVPSTVSPSQSLATPSSQLRPPNSDIR